MQNDILPGSPKDWLRHAKSDLIYAKYNDEDVLINQKCFHCQQAAEKSFKAVLIKYNIPIQKTHDIQKLIFLLSEVVIVPEHLRDSSILSDYAVEMRYPGDLEEITTEDYELALSLAEQVYNWAKEIIG